MKAWCRDVADGDVIFVAIGEEELLVDGLGWHFEGVGNACLCLVFLALSSSVERRVVS